MIPFKGCYYEYLVPQQRKLMGSSAQNSSGVHWCRRRVRFNEVPQRVPKVPAKGFSAEPGHVQQGVWRRFRIRFTEKVWEGSGEEWGYDGV